MLFTSVVAVALMPFMVQAAAIGKREEALIYLETFEDCDCINLKDFVQADNHGTISQSFSGSRASFKVIVNRGCGVTVYTTNGDSMNFPSWDLQTGTCFSPYNENRVAYVVFDTEVRGDQAASTPIAALY